MEQVQEQRAAWPRVAIALEYLDTNYDVISKFIKDTYIFVFNLWGIPS